VTRRAFQGGDTQAVDRTTERDADHETLEKHL